jgi:hypothetical protein
MRCLKQYQLLKTKANGKNLNQFSKNKNNNLETLQKASIARLIQAIPMVMTFRLTQ